MIEMYTCESEVFCHTESGVFRLEEGSAVVERLLERIEALYPDAMKALSDCYKRSIHNIPYYDFLRVRRFCKCNFGSLDHTEPDVVDGVFHFEKVLCPLRGECRYEGVICQPRMETRLSRREEMVMRLVCEGMENGEIAEMLYLSPNTVKRHVSTVFQKVGVRNRSEFVKYASENKLFV